MHDTQAIMKTVVEKLAGQQLAGSSRPKVTPRLAFLEHTGRDCPECDIPPCGACWPGNPETGSSF
jgi:hypothetical protein